MKGLEIISGNPPETHTHTVDLDAAKHPVSEKRTEHRNEHIISGTHAN